MAGRRVVGLPRRSRRALHAPRFVAGVRRRPRALDSRSWLAACR
jgi:hypothetical protein